MKEDHSAEFRSCVKVEVAVQGTSSLIVLYGLCGRKVALNLKSPRAQELCESGGGCPELPVPTKPDGFMFLIYE